MPDLIVNADDLGHAPGINRGIVKAHLDGIVTTSTVLTNYPDAPQGVELALAQAPRLELGVHFNLTEGRPVSDPAAVPSLVDEDGRFCGPERMGVAAQTWQADDLERELRAQVDRFVALAGQPPHHLDSHHGAPQWHPVALRILLDIAGEYRVPMRRVPVAATPEETARQWMYSSAPREAALAWAEALQDLVENHPAYKTTAHFTEGFYDRTATLSDLLLILTNLPKDGVTELMCHPGYAEGPVLSSYWEPREREVGLLTHPATREVIAAEGIRLIGFDDLP